jgi:hypothetical protein
MQTITIEQVEALATQLHSDEGTERAKLERLTTAYARILSAREPERFARQPLEKRDEAGHWDNSYPPTIEYCNYTGPRLIELSDCDYEDVPTSGGFYYDWKRVTTDPGLYVSRDGRIYGCEITGTGKLGQFAAHPGDCNVECELEYDERDDLSVEDLRTVETALRALAFPLSQGQ